MEIGTRCFLSQPQAVPVAQSCPIDPVLGGGALKVGGAGGGGNGNSEGGNKEGMPNQRARATGAMFCMVIQSLISCLC